MASSTKPNIVITGIARHVTSIDRSEFSKPGNRDGEIREFASGPVIQAASQVEALGGHALSVVIGAKQSAPYAEKLRTLIEESLSSPVSVDLLKETPRAIHGEQMYLETAYTAFEGDISPFIKVRIRAADDHVICPNHPLNAGQLEELLELNPRSYLCPSPAQVNHPSIRSLSQKAGCVVLSEVELSAWIDRRRGGVSDRIAELKNSGIKNLIVMTRFGVAASIDGIRYSEPGFEKSATKLETLRSECRDRWLATLLGTFLMYRDNGTQAALQRGLAARALYASGSGYFDDPQAIAVFANSRPRFNGSGPAAVTRAREALNRAASWFIA